MKLGSSLSRRSFLLGTVSAVGAVAIAACGGGGAPAAAPTSAPAAAPAAAPTPTTAPSAAAAPSSSGKPHIVIWYGVDFLPETTKTLAANFQDYGNQNNAEAEFVEKSGNWGDQLKAAVQAGTAVDIWQSYDYENQYWRAQKQALDLTDIYKQTSAQEGGWFEYVKATVLWKEKAWAWPIAVNAWPFHVRQDLLDAKNNGKWGGDSWDDFIAMCKACQDPPKVYGVGWQVSLCADTNNNTIGTLWTFGGALQNEDGSFGLKADDEAMIAVGDLMYNRQFLQEKIIPPAAVHWDTGDDNTAYQNGQLVANLNPTSIYAWLGKNKPDLQKATKFYNWPKGPKSPPGGFGMVDVWGVTGYLKTKFPDTVRGALAYVMKPDVHAKRIEDMNGRFLPVYQNLLDRPLWKTHDVYKVYTDIARNGRIMAFNSSPRSAYSEITTTNLLGEFAQDIGVKKLSAKEAYKNFYDKAQAIYKKYASED
jgi:hypothetical protein